MRRIFLMSSVLFVAPFTFGESGEVSAQCVATQDCASLGYTEASCPNGGIKCPFGQGFACMGNYGSKDDDINCTYGSIYYNDGICIKEFVSGRIPIGVVVYINPINGEKWIMSLSDSEMQNYDGTNSSNFYSDWDGSGGIFDIPEIQTANSKVLAVSDIKSCENTKFMSELSVGKYVLDYAPAGAENTKGKWCLPAAGIWNSITIHEEEISKGIKMTGGTAITSTYCQNDQDNYYWTSTECSKNQAWAWSGCMKGIKCIYKSRFDNSNNHLKSFRSRAVMKI